MLKRKLKKLYCCEKCRNYWTCETKWYRGEHGEENVCCSLCSFYEVCWRNILTPKQSSKKKSKPISREK